VKLEKVTRWYDDACGTAHALELVGERWSLLIARELMFGPRRFGELRRDLPGISANVLQQRLQGMERAGIVARVELPPPASVRAYDLTDWGREAEAPIAALGRWAVRSPDHDVTLPLSPASLMMSLRTMYKGGATARIGFRLGADRFVVTLTDRTLAVDRSDPDRADATVTAAPEAVAAIVYGGVPLAVAEAEGMMTVAGDRALVEALPPLFPLPPKLPS
jgi:DNA-binding HxlR family transcriptional regulator